VKTDLEDCPEGFNGNDPKNIVNRLGANGIHIEQSSDARARFGCKIAHAVAGVIGPKIEGLYDLGVRGIEFLDMPHEERR
jgi:hypothetical protein